jgi:hypothetical protein
MTGIARLTRRLLLPCALVLPLVLAACSQAAEEAPRSIPALGEIEGASGDSSGSQSVAPSTRAQAPTPAPASPVAVPVPASASASVSVSVSAPETVASRRDVRVNGARITDAQLATLERDHGIEIVDGAYWYDAKSGAAGLIGGPTATFVRSGLALGGPLAVDASGGRTGVLVNGRELPEAELAALVPLVGPLEPGRYFVDAAGNAGREGEPPTVNLLVLASQAMASGGGDGWYAQSTDAGGNESDGSGYVMGRDGSGNVWSVSY